MNTYCKTMLRLFAGCLLLIGLACILPTSVAAEPFTLTSYDSLRDNATGLEWGKHIGHYSHSGLVEGHVSTFYVDNPDNPPNGPEYAGPEDEPYTDWRPPTVGEMLVAVDNGLLDHLDFTYFDDIDVSYDDPNVDRDGNLFTYGDLPYWSTCVEMYRGQTLRYKFWFSPDAGEPEYLRASGGAWHIGVRGTPEDHSNCPGRHYKAPKPDKPGKPVKPPKLTAVPEPASVVLVAMACAGLLLRTSRGRMQTTRIK